MQNPLRIALLTGDSPSDINAWSGTLYYMHKSLKSAGCKIITIGPAKPVFTHLYLSILNQLSINFFGKRIDYRHSKIYAKAYGRIFTKRLSGCEFDIVLAVGGSEFAAYLDTTKPIVLVVDRTIAGAIEYHNILKNLWPWSQNQSIETDKLAMTRSDLNIYASDWARDAARTLYNIAEKKAITIPFGANLDKIPPSTKIYERLKQTEVLKLLFIGRDWETKGGAKAIDCYNAIVASGISVELHVVGCEIPEEIRKLSIIGHGFLNKNISSELKILTELYLQSHFFILPTKFEAYGLVFVESAAFGLPSIGPNTGGVPTAMANGQSGILMNENCSGVDYAQELLKLWTNKKLYEEQVIKTRNAFETGFTWEVWTKHFLLKISQLQRPNSER